MLVHEYRVVLPLTVAEYQVAQLYTIAEMSKSETGGGEGCEILRNESFTDQPLMNGRYSEGQYTLKIYHVESKIPTLIKLIVPRGSKQVYEECWNSYPYMKTVLTNPGFMKDAFRLEIESFHRDDRGDEENVLELCAEALKKREVTVIDIANDPVASRDRDPCMDPRTYSSTRTGRGPLGEHWRDTVTPVMTCYKLVTVNFKWFGFQGRVERFLQHFERRVFTVFHRRLFCTTDEWYGLTLEDVRVLEEETKKVLDRERTCGTLRGTRSGSHD